MRTKSNLFLTTLAAAALCLGCAAGDEPREGGGERVAESRAALDVQNGWELNGTELNGTFLNGIQQNGIQQNGIQQNGIQQNGTGLAGVSTETGLEVGGDAFTGATMAGVLGDLTPVTLTIAGVTSGLVAGMFTYQITYGGNDICASSGGQALILPGRWDYSTATYVGGSDFTVACLGAAIAKCVKWGYSDFGAWKESNGASNHDISLNYFHQACVRMVRADYCGDGNSHTVNGTIIDVFDAAHIQDPTPGGTLPFEAEWSPTGATCVKHPRWATASYGNVESYIKGHPSCDHVWAGPDRPAANAACGTSTWASFTSNGYSADPLARPFLRNNSDQH